MTENQAAAGQATVQISRAGSEITIGISGSVNVDSSPRVRSALLSLIRQSALLTIIVDLSQVLYLDTSGIATLLEALNIAHDNSVRLRLFGIRDQPRSLAELVELESIFQALGAEVNFA
jgi:anti-sigma B factor antagonist